MTGRTGERPYHPIFRSWLEEIDQDIRKRDDGSEVPLDLIHRSLDRLRMFMTVSRRMDRNYVVHDSGRSYLLTVDEIPIDCEMKWLHDLLMNSRVTQDLLPWDELREVLAGLLPWLTHAGDATATWYRILEQLMDIHPVQGERVLQAIFEAGKKESSQVAQLALGAIDFVRLRRQRKARAESDADENSPGEQHP